MDIHVTPENITEQETEPVVVKHHRLSSILPIIVFSYVGLLIRLGLGFLGNYRTPLNVGFWPNFVGCLIMGFVVEQKIHIHHHFPQLYIGLTTGLCGSITTFSGVMYKSCVALFGQSSHDTYPISNYIAVIISIFSSSFIGFIFGRHLSLYCLNLPMSAKLKNIPILSRSLRTWLFPILILLILPTIIVLAIVLPTGRYTYFIYSIIFAPFGSLTRYILSILFNKNSNFPLGTLIANVTGSYIYFGMVAIHEYVPTLSPLVKQIIVSIIQGYCGCLTTVSTFLLELNTIEKFKYLYAYIIITVIPIQIVYIILGDIFSFLCSSKL